MGRGHERPAVHDRSSRFAFGREKLWDVVGWLALSRGGLGVLADPETGDGSRTIPGTIWLAAIRPLEEFGPDIAAVLLTGHRESPRLGRGTEHVRDGQAGQRMSRRGVDHEVQAEPQRPVGAMQLVARADLPHACNAATCDRPKP